MTNPRISRHNALKIGVVLGLTASCLATWIGLSNATSAPEMPPWVQCDTPEVDKPQREFASPCMVSMPDLPEEILVVDVHGEVVGAVDARLLFARPPAPSADVHDKTGDQYHPEDPPLEVFGPSDTVVGIVDNTGFVPEEEIP